MSKILQINPTGLFSYGMSSTIELDRQGLIQLNGQNGTGKSSLLNAICHIIFGECPVKGVTDTTILNKVWNNGYWGLVKFIGHDQNIYRIIISRKWKNEYPDKQVNQEASQLHEQNKRYGGTDVYFDIWQNNKWFDLRLSKTLDTRKLIIQKFGMSYKQFLVNSYLAQQTGSLLVTGTNKERMQIVTELTNMNIWDRACQHTREKLSRLTQQLQEYRNKLQGINVVQSTLPAILSDTEIISYESKLLDSYNQSTQLNVKLSDITNNIKLLQDEQDKHQQEYLTALKNISDQITILHDNKSILQTKQFQDIAAISIANTDDYIRQIETTKAQLVIQNSQLSKLMGDSGVCDRCGSTVDSQHLHSVRQNYEDNIKQLNHTLSTLNTEYSIRKRSAQSCYDEVTSQILLKFVEESKQIDIKIQQCNKQKQDIELQFANLDIVNNIKRLQSEYQIVQSANVKILQDIQYINNILDNNTKAIEQHRVIQTQITDLTNHINQVETQAAILQVCLTGMGDKGIKAYKFGTCINQLNEVLKTYIDILTDGHVQVWFTPFKEKVTAKHADDISVEIQIMVQEGIKSGIDIALYSGAERQQITLAISTAFWKLANMHNNGTNVLWLDEIFGCMSPNTINRTIKFIEQLKTDHQGTIIITTHSDYVKNNIKVDHEWVTIKTNHISTLEIR
jgi:prepilin-type processing-associated H-X9-DG protein